MNVLLFLLKCLGVSIVIAYLLSLLWALWSLGYEYFMSSRKEKQLTRLLKLRADALEENRNV